MKFNPFTGTFDIAGGGSAALVYPALFVAANDASDRDKNGADYVCDGTDDDVQIQAALDALPSNGGTVILSTGTFSTGDTIDMTEKQRLIGQGIDATHIQADSSFHVIHMGNRQADAVMRNFMVLEEMSVSAAGGANSFDAVWVDGGGNGTHIVNVKASEGKYNFRLTDIDQAYFQGIKAFNAREAGIYCEVGLENTWGNVAFYSPSTAISDANKVGWLFDASPAQVSPNRFDRISIYGALFYSTTGLAGTIGLKMNVGATAFTIIGSLFESNIHQIDLLDETQLTLIGDSFIQNSGVSTNIIRCQTDNHSVTIQDCRMQQATNAFNGASGFTKLCFLGRSTNQGNITNMFAGTFGAKQGTDTVFAGDNTLASGLDNEKYDYGFFNHMVVDASAVFNEEGGVNDFRVEGEDDTHLIYADADHNAVLINESSWDSWAKLLVNGGARFNDDFRFQKGSGDQYIARIGGSAYNLVHQINNIDLLRLNGDGTVKIGEGSGTTSIILNESGANADVRIEGDTDANLIFTDASTDRVGVGNNAPNSKLDVTGTAQMDGLRIDVSPTAEVVIPTHTITISVNGTNYKIPIVAA